MNERYLLVLVCGIG